MAVITPKVASLAGVDPLTYPTASAGGDSFPAQAGNRYLIHVKNGETTSRSLVIDDPTSQQPSASTQFNPDVTVPVPNAGERMIFVNNPGRFMDAEGDINLSWTGGTVASVTFQVIRV